MKRILVDARKLRCPLPLLKLKQGIVQAALGDEIALRATDAGSWRDVPAFIGLTKHTLTEQMQVNDEYWFVVVKGE